MTRRQHLAAADFVPLAREAVGGHRTLAAATRLTGGSRKGVYRLAFDDDSTVIAYVWSPQEDYWARPASDVTDSLSDATGPGLFRSAHARLTALGVRVPRLLLLDEDAVHLPAYAAVVEDVTGGTLEDALRDDPARARPAVRRLAETLRVLRSCTAAGHGEVTLVEEGGTPLAADCAQATADHALRDIDELCVRDPRVAAVQDRLRERVRRLRHALAPRDTCSLVHGELGPDHVLLTPGGEPVLIDIEGLKYFDAEGEHAFLELRFGPWYDMLRAPGLDEDRMALHRLAVRLSLVAGPLRLLDGDWPDPAPMRAVAEANLRWVLASAGRDGTAPGA
ncbi:phosphotransferase family protein [Streptomyces sp. NPDC017936]|uniref:phosphotransferase family protein n=1 Tax=Streptomyces sp. NPDC017936 TaxID=3365016 RepID=UPI00378BBE51